MNIVFFGAGSMAEAIISGWTASPTLPPLSICVTNKSDHEALIRLKETYGVSLVSDSPEILEQADYIVLAMKPKDAAEAFPLIKNRIPKNSTIISVLAGIDIDTLSDFFTNQPIIRVMPNTSATIGKSATAISHNALVTDTSIQLISELFRTIGSVEVVKDQMMHAVTALSGSGPAYIYYVTELLERAAMEHGFTAEEARALVLQTLDGAVSMMKETKQEPATLRKRVTSPGGTTEAGLKAMAECGMEHAILTGIDAATKQSKVLGQNVKDSISR
ncbi:pyrroline-5-carboxylate reductase [Chryseomicrobium palamuruense]|uniref:Pyrroline-5-carboxylate reductase n=1 Tax=Chryseomicrobium palamuruense TaxID=682973 RepID=A0ABV8UYD8_9BACL